MKAKMHAGLVSALCGLDHHYRKFRIDTRHSLCLRRGVSLKRLMFIDNTVVCLTAVSRAVSTLARSFCETVGPSLHCLAGGSKEICNIKLGHDLHLTHWFLSANKPAS